MRRTRLAIAGVFTLVGALALTTPATARPPSDPGGRDNLEVYVGTVDAGQLDELRRVGVDLGHDHGGTDSSGRTEIETVLSRGQAEKLSRAGVELKVKKVRGKAASQVLREQAATGWTAFRSYSAPGGIRDEITATAARHPKLTKWRPSGGRGRASRSSPSRSPGTRRTCRTASAPPCSTPAPSTPASGSPRR